MALFIRLSNEFETGKWNIASYGKTGDIEISSWPQINESPAPKRQCFYTSTGIELKTTSMLVEEYANEKIEEMRELIYTRWIDSSKAVTAMQAQYSNFRTNALAATSTGEVDDEFETLETWLDLSD